MATVFFDKKYTNICSLFAEDKVALTDEKIFKTNMDLAVFAAILAVGKSRVPVEVNGSEIPDRVFYNNQKEGIVYLIALLDTEDPYVLKDDKQCWKIFQEYVNCGMKEISGWLVDNPIDAAGVDTLLNEIMQKASKLIIGKEQTAEVPEIDFS